MRLHAGEGDVGRDRWVRPRYYCPSLGLVRTSRAPSDIVRGCACVCECVCLSTRFVPVTIKKSSPTAGFASDEQTYFSYLPKIPLSKVLFCVCQKFAILVLPLSIALAKQLFAGSGNSFTLSVAKNTRTLHCACSSLRSFLTY